MTLMLLLAGSTSLALCGYEGVVALAFPKPAEPTDAPEDRVRYCEEQADYIERRARWSPVYTFLLWSGYPESWRELADEWREHAAQVAAIERLYPPRREIQ